MKQSAKEVILQGDRLFTKKQSLDSLWQEIALNFYPERADFTDVRIDGEEWAEHLYTSYPSMARRELANLVATSLRPRAQKWFSIHTANEFVDANDEVRRYLEYISNVQWRAMYNPKAGLIRATKQADHDFVSFGNAVIQVSPNLDLTGLLYRNYHLRDCAWAENAEGSVDVIHRKWKASAKKIYETFPQSCSKEIKNAYKKDPFKEFVCRHVVMPADMWDGAGAKKKEQFPFVSIMIEQEGENILEEVPQRHFGYIIPRWHTLDCSAYGVSMATAVCLPDGRTQQVIARTMLEAGEKYVDPPMIAVTDAIRDDIAMYAGGITTVDAEYDEKTGEVLRPIGQDRGGYPIAESISATLREDIANGFFLNKIQLPDSSGDMTAYETRQRIQEYIRAAAPIFEPIEQEYNDPICEATFNLLMDFGAFPTEGMPDELQGSDINFAFRSPMADMAEQQDAEVFVDAVGRVLMPAAEMDQSQMEHVDWDTAVRDAMKAAGFKAKWFKPLEQVMQRRQQMMEQMQEQQEAENAMRDADAALSVKEVEEAERGNAG